MNRSRHNNSGCVLLAFATLILCATVLGQQPSVAEQPPVIATFPNVQNHVYHLHEGNVNAFSLECAVKGEPKPQLQWFKDGVSLDSQALPDGLSLTGDDLRSLEFTEPSAVGHRGYYHCQASNRLGSATSEVVLVTDQPPTYPDWAVAPTFVDKPEVEITEVGRSAEFRCSATGDPEPDITWSKNGEVLTQNQGVKVLTIDSVDTSDIGTYACNASNLAGYDYKVVYLNILTQSPYLIESPRNQTVSISQEVSLRCLVKGYPLPTINWLYNGQPIQADDEQYAISTAGDQLTVKKVTKEHSKGMFTCKAANVHGQTQVSANLQVVSITTIQDGPVDSTATVKSTVKMNCSVLWDRSFQLTILWKKDNVDLLIDGVKFLVDSDSNALTINDLAFEDAGTYTCVASTKTGTATDSGTLTVAGIPPSLITGPTDMTVSEGTHVQIPCKTDGVPTPDYTWFKNTEKIKSGPHYTIMGDGTLVIAEATQADSAKYICRAENGYGNPVVESSFVDVRSKSKVVAAPQHVAFEEGSSVMFDCAVDVDPALKENVVVQWLKDDTRLEVLHDTASEDSEAPGLEVDLRHIMFSNASLLIKDVTNDDVGTYTCQVKTAIDEIVMAASLYSNDSWLWILILILVLVCLLLLILIICCCCCLRKRARKTGKYGVKDMEAGKKKPHKSSIHYSIDEDTDSVSKEMSLLDPDANAPAYTPRTLKQISDMAKGSEHSLLNMTDEEHWLGRGMEEDGSFRGRYLE